MFSFEEGIHSIDDLEIGMILPGVVTNVTNFGAFVDLGIKVKGLVHVSQLADRFVRDPNEVVHVHNRCVFVCSKSTKPAAALHFP